jgi:uncharacterized OsmC-like protein
VFSLKVSYDGGQHATAVNEPHHNVVAIDCPFTGKGEEFSPGSLLALSVASCMLLSMGAIAQRDDLDIKGTVVDVGIRGMEKTFPHVDAISLAFKRRFRTLMRSRWLSISRRVSRKQIA